MTCLPLLEQHTTTAETTVPNMCVTESYLHSQAVAWLIPKSFFLLQPTNTFFL
jgi:hypothetical protein